MRLALAAGGALLLALLTWLLLRGIDTKASAYAETQRAFDDFALAEASIARDVLQARAGLLGNYDVLAEAEEAMESAAGRIRSHVEAENLDPKPVEALAAAVGQYEDLIERFKTGNSLLQNSLSYVGQLSTDPAFGALGDQFAPSATALAAAVLRLARDSSPESAKSLQQHASPSRQPFEETREFLARAQAAFEVTAQRFRVLLYAVSLGLLGIALRLGQRLWTRTLRIRRLVDANIIGIFIWDFDGRILEANETFLHITGYDHEDLVEGRIRWTDLTPPELRDRDTRLIQEHKVTGTLRPFEKEYFRKDGSRVPVLIGVATFEEGGNQGVAFVLDLTERKRAEEALRESERSSRSAFDGIAGLVAVMTPNWEVETVNRQCLEYFGRSLEWIKNWATNDAVHPEDLPHVVEFFKKELPRGIPYRHELRMRRFDGEYRWFDNRGVPIRDESGRIVRWYVLLVDIEDRTRALARLDQMQSDFAHTNRVSMMGELAASLSHEITQPIASARNNARAAQNFLDKQPPDLGEVREALSCVVGDTDRAGDIIDRIREHMKKAPPRKGHFDLNEAINEVIVLGRSAIIKKGVWVQTRLSEGLFPVHGDRVQLQQVVLNLLLNAVEAMGSVEGAPRELLISTKQDHTGVLVAVHDSGPGIHPEHLERVFDAFHTTKSSGMGIGLSICRSIIDAHGGRLWAEANEPRGVVFQFTLPGVEG